MATVTVATNGGGEWPALLKWDWEFVPSPKGTEAIRASCLSKPSL